MNQQDLSSWRRYTASMCQSCVANCCKMPVEVSLHDLVNLNLIDAFTDEKTASKKLGKQKIIESYRDRTKTFILSQKSDGSCIFLNENNQCSHYENRPTTCRDFPTKKSSKLGFCPYSKKN